MIFHDSTLHEMVASRPATRDAFRKLKGVGDVKLRRYSGIFLDCISGKYTEASAGSELPPAGLSAADRIAGRAGGSGMSDWHLVTALRQLRAHLADSQGVPEYVIFPNYTLDEMVEKRPASPEEFLDLKGVGEVKLGKYGPAFLRVINAE